jgi:pimeloyl-ACP methyl ester carboxylesterase
MTQSPLPIVFIPGASSDESAWDQQRAYFEKRAPVQVANLTGFDDIGAMADHILRIAPPEFIVCGTSMGGYVALDVLKKAKGRVKKAILCNTSARADTPERKRQRQMEIAQGEEAYRQARLDDSHYAAFLSEKSMRNKALIARLRGISERVGYGCFKRHQTACAMRSESLSFLPQIDIPVLVVGGADDKLIPPALQEEIHASIKGSQLAILPDAGHCAQLETAEAMTSALEKFLFSEA